MKIAITIVAAPGSKELLLNLASSLQRELNGGLAFGWLAEGEAMDLVLETAHEGPARKTIKATVAAAIGASAADFCVQAAAGRRKRMLIADMDSTVIGQECLDEMADLKGIKPEIADLTERAMRGELDFEAALRERIRLLKGLSKANLHNVLCTRITLNPGAKTLVATMNGNGAHTVLVSGGFTFFTDALSRQVGFSSNRANIFLWDEEGLAGVAEPILGREAKLAALEEEAAAHGLSGGDAIAVGDGANDLAMLKAAGLGVAYYAKPIVAEGADAEIKHTDLTSLLYFQGYAKAEFLGDKAV